MASNIYIFFNERISFYAYNMLQISIKCAYKNNTDIARIKFFLNQSLAFTISWLVFLLHRLSTSVSIPLVHHRSFLICDVLLCFANSTLTLSCTARISQQRTQRSPMNSQQGNYLLKRNKFRWNFNKSC